MICCRLQTELGLHLTLGAAQVAHQDEGGPFVQDVLNRRQCRADPGVIGNRTVLQGNIEIDAHEHALALQINITNRLLVHIQSASHIKNIRAPRSIEQIRVP